MFQLSQAFLNQPVMSLRTGAKVSDTLEAIINPNNLKIEGFYCQSSANKKERLILLSQDIRDIIPQGIAINDEEVLAPPEELVRLKDIMALHFNLMGKPVVTVSKDRVGKVNDYAADPLSFIIQKLYVSQSLIKNFSGGGLSVDRNQIVEITNRKIVIQDLLESVTAPSAATVPAS
jgi:uncharacterized protein YrrD